MPKEHGHAVAEDRIEDVVQLLDPQSDRGILAERVLIGLGATLLLIGTILLLIPTVTPQYGWILKSLAARGVTSVPALAAGVLLGGIWIALRTIRGHSIAAQESILVTESPLQRLAEEIARQGDSLQGLRIELVYLKDVVQANSERVQASASNSTGADAMFRLAASLDQLGARIEERINANHREVCESLQYVSDRVETVRSQESGRLLLGEYGVNDSVDEPTPEAERAQVWEARGLDDEAGTDGDRPRLGLLDLLDDLGRLLPRKTSSVVERPEAPGLDFEDVHDEGWKHHTSIPAPLPSPRGGEEIRLTGPGELLAGGLPRAQGEAPVVAKLEELRSLLADDRVREALAAIERERR